jgi:hypothetical protein
MKHMSIELIVVLAFIAGFTAAFICCALRLSKPYGGFMKAVVGVLSGGGPPPVGKP